MPTIPSLILFCKSKPFSAHFCPLLPTVRQSSDKEFINED